MASFERGGVKLHYEIAGEGAPVLLLAPGGMRSAIGAWARVPWNPLTALPDAFQTIAMDQRNAGLSVAPIGPEDGWSTYADDHLALLDHLGVGRCHLVGCCIGGAFIMKLIDVAPERVASAVLMQPIGRSPDNGAVFSDLFEGWVREQRASHPEADEATWRGFAERMFGGDFVFSVDRAAARRCRAPLLVLLGDDQYHPSAISREVVELAEDAELIERWKTPEAAAQAGERIMAFLAAHAGALQGA